MRPSELGGPRVATGWSTRLREARRIAQPSPETYAFSDVFYRALSIFPSLCLARIGVTPNQITLLWAALGLVALIALASPSYAPRLAGAVLLQLSYLLDFVDGEVARLQASTSKRGYFLDLVGHGLVKTGLFLALGYGAFMATGRLEMLWLACVACVSVANIHMLPFYAYVAEVVRSATPKSGLGAAASRLPGIRWMASSVGLLFESPGLYAATLVAVVVGLEGAALAFYAVLGPLWLLYRGAQFRYEASGAAGGSSATQGPSRPEGH
jgi:phosphatidylglycerophosphate synthase